MRYTYDMYARTKLGSDELHRVGTTTNVNELTDDHVTFPNHVVVFDNLDQGKVRVLTTPDDLLGHRTAVERASAWPKPNDAWDPFDKTETDIQMVDSKEELGTARKDAINPQYYRDFLAGRQWIETRQERVIRRYGPHAWLAVLETMTYKYLDRCGGKDPESQELQKALWYMKFMTAFVKNGLKPIRVEEVDDILAR